MTTKERAIQLRKEHPEWKGSKIAEICECSREYIRQVLKANNLPNRRTLPLEFCLNCHRPRNPFFRHFCSIKCRSEYARVTLVCSTCGKEFYIREKDLQTRVGKRIIKGKFWCSRECYGYWFGKNFGRGKH